MSKRTNLMEVVNGQKSKYDSTNIC